MKRIAFLAALLLPMAANASYGPDMTLDAVFSTGDARIAWSQPIDHTHGTCPLPNEAVAMLTVGQDGDATPHVGVAMLCSVPAK